VRVVAPGKLLLTGAYAVLEGAPAIVCAVSRLAVAGGERRGAPSAEVAAAMHGAEAPGIDVSDLFAGSQKLGLGSSAAAVVAALGYQAALAGEDLADAGVRRRIFDRARLAHAAVQSGGSGVDIAASVYGGALRYRLHGEAAPSVDPVALPAGLRIDTYWSGTSVRTSDMRARVEARKVRAPSEHAARMAELGAAALAASTAVDRGHVGDFVLAVQAAEKGLRALGRDADAPIVPPSVEGLVRLAEEEKGAFCPSGAGGGDVFVRVGQAPASPRFTAEAAAAGLEKIELEIDVLGVRVRSKVGEPSS